MNKTTHKKKSIEIALQCLANKIREERKSQGLSQTELASLAAVSLNFLSQLESGKKVTARMDKILQVMTTLGLQFDIKYGQEVISK